MTGMKATPVQPGRDGAAVLEGTHVYRNRLAFYQTYDLYRPAIHLTSGIQGYAQSDVKRPISATRRFHAFEVAPAIAL
jgi:hypothetical protein